MKENRIIVRRKDSKKIRDYSTRKEATLNYYEMCDKLGLTYGRDIYLVENGKRVHKGLETSNNELTISLYI